MQTMKMLLKHTFRINRHKRQRKCTRSLYSRLGSNPVINSGHGACAEDPAGVSAQHDHPSKVPGQNRPVTAISDLEILKKTLLYRVWQANFLFYINILIK
jgi:hypothetical protein